MPYILISTQIRLENGPTVVGDEDSDVALMSRLGAELKQTAGNTFKEWVVASPPRKVLDHLEEFGYRVVASTGIGQTAIWTLHQ